MGEGQPRPRPQAVPGRQTAGQEPRVPSRYQQGVPEGRNGIRSEEELKAELTGVAGPGEEERLSSFEPHARGGVRTPLEGEVDQVRKGGVRIRKQSGEDAGGGRSLDVQFAEPAGQVVDGDRTVPGVVLQVAGDPRPHAGVDHDEEIRLVKPVDQGVVEAVPGLIEKGAIGAAAPGERGDIPGEAALQEGEGVLSRHPDPRHVAGVKETRCGQHSQVLLAGAARIPERHFVAAKIGHVGAGGRVAVVQGGGQEYRGRVHVITIVLVGIVGSAGDLSGYRAP